MATGTNPPDRYKWKGRKNSTEGYRWRNERCPFCGLRYHKEFKLKEILDVEDTFAFVYNLLEEEEKRLREAGEYPPPKNLNKVLGRMFQLKQEHWKEHLTQCERGCVLEAAALGLELEDVMNALEEGQFAIDYLNDYCPF